jgi:hypothetical protein
MILFKAARKGDFLLLFLTLLRKHIQLSKPFVVTKKEMYKFQIYVQFSSVAVFHLFSFNILYCDCTVM